LGIPPALSNFQNLLHKSRWRWVTPGILPFALRPSGHLATRDVQNRFETISSNHRGHEPANLQPAPLATQHLSTEPPIFGLSNHSCQGEFLTVSEEWSPVQARCAASR